MLTGVEPEELLSVDGDAVLEFEESVPLVPALPVVLAVLVSTDSHPARRCVSPKYESCAATPPSLAVGNS